MNSTRSTLDEIGIQQWRLRKQVTVADTSVAEAKVIESATELENAAIALSVAQSEGDSQSEQSLEKNLEKNSDKTDLDYMDWPALEALVNSGAQCQSCSQHNSLLGSGSREAQWLFLSDSPNSKEVAAGAFYDGRAGQLFEAMLQALKLDRESVYCTSIFKCAPTEDLSNSPLCGGWLHRQIELVKPKVIVTFGEFTAQTLLRSNETLAQMRERTQKFKGLDAIVVPTYSPRKMLENPSLKSRVWVDLKKAIRL